MSNIFDPVVALWKSLSTGRLPLPMVAFIPAQSCEPAGSAGYPIRRDEMYFTIRINEFHLAENREWWSVYDPMVLVVCEFGYGKDRIAVPTVIGPNLIQKKNPGDQPRHGVVLLDARVTGPHPFRGGDIDLSVALYKVKRVDYARNFLKAVDTLSTALGDLGQMQAVAKTGGALLEGVEAILGLPETEFLAGHRVSMASSPVKPLAAGSSALITPTVPSLSNLVVINDRLHLKSDGAIKPYRSSDFVLLSIAGSESRGDSLLPFYQMKTDALMALWDGEGGNDRAKANLIAAYQQMRKSTDMTELECGRLFDAWLAEFENEKKRVTQVRAMPLEQRSPEIGATIKDLNNASLRVSQL